jgi:hypothetical protein
MSTPTMLRTPVRSLGLLALATLAVACSDQSPTDLRTPPITPSFSALSAVTVTSITFETRQWDNYNDPTPGSTVNAIALYNSLPTATCCHTGTPVSLTSLSGVNNQLFFPSFNGGMGYHVKVELTTGAGSVGLRFGVDFGKGGTLLVDGVEQDARWYDLWWGGTTFDDPNNYLTATVELAAGPHTIELYGFENCCDGVMQGEINLNGVWHVITTGTVTNDATPPAVTCSATPNELWPANHKLMAVSVNVSVTDDESGPAGFSLVSVTSNEADSGLGDGDTADDIQGWSTGTADTEGQLRAERSGQGTGRVYTFTYEGTDLAGNSATATCSVGTPHSQK